MKREQGIIENHIDTTSVLVFSVGNRNKGNDTTIATDEEIANKRRIDLKRLAQYGRDELRLLPKAVIRFRNKHIDEISALKVKQRRETS